MPFAEINIVPSVNIETTDSDNPSGVTMSNFIRWRANLPEKRGGCSLFVNQQLDGIPNDVQPWSDITNDAYLAIATDKEIYNYSYHSEHSQGLIIISPKYDTAESVTPNISTVKDSSQVTIIDNSSVNATIYDSVTFNTPVAAGGIILQGTYQIIRGSGNLAYVIDAGFLASATTTAAGTVPVFTTEAGSSTVQVTFPTQYQTGTPHSLAVGDRIGYTVPTSVGGLTVYGQYLITSIIDTNNFTIVDNEAATSSATASMNGGNLNLTYWVVNGPTVTGPGYGANEYGQYAYGKGTSKPPLPGATYHADNWYLDSRGSSLIACAVKKPLNNAWEPSPIFYWNDSYGFKNLAILNNAPISNNGAFVAMPYGHIMAWGCSEIINPLSDPLHIRWSSSTDPDNWSLAGNSDAGFYNVPTGSKVVRGIQGATQQYWFTDIDLYAAQYVGYPGTYGFNKIGSGCGLIAPKAVGVLGGSMYWMSQKQFFVCPSGGAPQAIPCSVWDFIFQNMVTQYADHVICGTNSLFNEVTWFFPAQTDPSSVASGEQTAYVCYNAQYNEWDVGYINRTAWYDQSQLGPPIGTDSDGWVYQHETTYNNAVGNTIVPINAWFRTGYYSLSAGSDLTFVDWVIPDMKWSQYSDPDPDTADLQLTFYVTDYPGQEPRVHGPYPFGKGTKFINPRMRGRYVSFKIESNDINSFWRLGSFRYRFAGAGRR